MIKGLLIYTGIAILLIGVHQGIAQALPQLELPSWKIVYLPVLFIALQSHILFEVAIKKTKFLPGMVFLGTSMLQFLLLGFYAFALKKMGTPTGIPFILPFMATFFLFLGISIAITLKKIQD